MPLLDAMQSEENFARLRELMGLVQDVRTFEDSKLEAQAREIVSDIIEVMQWLMDKDEIKDSDTFEVKSNNIDGKVKKFEEAYFLSLAPKIAVEFQRVKNARTSGDNTSLNQARRNLIIMRNYWDGIPKDYWKGIPKAQIDPKVVKETNKKFALQEKRMDKFQAEAMQAERLAAEIQEMLGSLSIEYDSKQDVSHFEETLEALRVRWLRVPKEGLDERIVSSINSQLNEHAVVIVANVEKIEMLAEEIHGKINEIKEADNENSVSVSNKLQEELKVLRESWQYSSKSFVSPQKVGDVNHALKNYDNVNANLTNKMMYSQIGMQILETLRLIVEAQGNILQSNQLNAELENWRKEWSQLPSEKIGETLVSEVNKSLMQYDVSRVQKSILRTDPFTAIWTLMQKIFVTPRKENLTNPPIMHQHNLSTLGSKQVQVDAKPPEPEKPSESKKPPEPEKPSESKKPSVPEKPSESKKPSGPEKLPETPKPPRRPLPARKRKT